MRDLEAGVTAMKSVLDRANAAIDRTKKDQEVDDLVGRVDDWKGHRIEHFGQLITYGNHTVLKSDSGKEEREVRPRHVPFAFDRLVERPVFTLMHLLSSPPIVAMRTFLLTPWVLGNSTPAFSTVLPLTQGIAFLTIERKRVITECLDYMLLIAALE